MPERPSEEDMHQEQMPTKYLANMMQDQKVI